MNVGDLYDLLEEKLGTGEFSRIDDLDVEGYSIDSIDKASGVTVRIYIDEDFPDCSNCFNESEDSAEITRLTEKLDEIRELLDEAEEINIANYDVDQVAALNDFYIEVSKLVEDAPDAAA